MRFYHALPVIAALALAACGDKSDSELQDAALSADEVSGEAASVATDFALPEPGQYRTSQELLEFSLPSLPAEQMEMVRAQFAAGAAQQHTYCVNEEMTHEQWLSNMSESNCTVARGNSGSGAIDLVLTCNGEEGVTGRVEMKGQTSSNGADMEMTFAQAIPNMGEGTIRMRVKSERVGDCS